MRNTPSRGASYPVAATAVAHAYDYDEKQAPQAERFIQSAPDSEQQPLFSTLVNEPRVISFDTLASPAEREAIRARAAEVARPAPVRHAKVEVRRARPKGTRAGDQRTLEFQGQEEVLSPPLADIICDAPVAPPALRVESALIDSAIVGFGCGFVIACYLYAGGSLLPDKHGLLFLLAVLATVPVAYKFLWTWAGRDSIGTQAAGLVVVDFDGNPPSRERRYYRTFGSVLSLLAAGIGLIWALVDEDSLTWHDHISSTFPTVLDK